MTRVSRFADLLTGKYDCTSAVITPTDAVVLEIRNGVQGKSYDLRVELDGEPTPTVKACPKGLVEAARDAWTRAATVNAPKVEPVVETCAPAVDHPRAFRPLVAACNAVRECLERFADVSVGSPAVTDRDHPRAEMLVTHVDGGRGHVVVRQHHDYLYVDKAFCKGVPAVLVRAAETVVAVVAQDHDMRRVA